MAAAILGSRRRGTTEGTALDGLGVLRRDAKRDAAEKLRNKGSILLGGGGLQQSPARRAAPLEGLGR